MWPDRRLCELLKIEHPIIQAPMAGAATPELASAVCNAGGLGSLGSAEMTLPDVRTVAARMRAATNRPFNLNFFIAGTPKTDAAILQRTRERLQPWYDALGLGVPPDTLPDLPPAFGDDHMALLLEIRPAVVSFHFGMPDHAAIAALKAAGITLISSATTVAEARALEASGMDAVIAQGLEAGGHRGSHTPRDPGEGVGTLALVPQIADAVSVPVIAAGGIGDGRGIAAAFALGAAGVQIGTGFLSCPEAGTDPARRALLRSATDTDTMVTNAFSGRPARAMRSRYAEEIARSREPLPAFQQMYALSGPIEAAAADDEASFHLYGQAAALNRELPAAELLRQLVAETAQAFGRVSTA
ncbi:nitronate monooxygenase [Tabrizicola sp.]|uniref:NAD(P)H-dependent flavin oxidoreductase n=1 Tax=Tabrizicola sp. TaxID=2005166 RepID=UPI00286B7BF9|nr:nitronate monooxygenase [Tabrizicola sp.]